MTRKAYIKEVWVKAIEIAQTKASSKTLLSGEKIPDGVSSELTKRGEFSEETESLIAVVGFADPR
jgi:hypothetical protein